MNAYVLFAFLCGGIGFTLFGIGMGFMLGQTVGEKRGQEAAEFAYSYGLLGNNKNNMLNEQPSTAPWLQGQQAQLTGAAPNPYSSYGGGGLVATGGVPNTYYYSVGGGGGGGSPNQQAYAVALGGQAVNPLSNYASHQNATTAGYVSTIPTI